MSVKIKETKVAPSIETTKSKIIGFTFASMPFFCKAIDDITKAKTKKGAIAFNASTNRSPSMVITGWPLGKIMAKITPNTIPLTT